jgi:hypothetical protein
MTSEQIIRKYLTSVPTLDLQDLEKLAPKKWLAGSWAGCLRARMVYQQQRKLKPAELLMRGGDPTHTNNAPEHTIVRDHEDRVLGDEVAIPSAFDELARQLGKTFGHKIQTMIREELRSRTTSIQMEAMDNVVKEEKVPEKTSEKEEEVV